MGLLPDTSNCGLRMRRECRERFPRHQRQRKPLVSDPGMHHGTCVSHVPWCMSRSLTRGGRGKCSRHSRRMRNPQFYVSGKRPIARGAIIRASGQPQVDFRILSCDAAVFEHSNWSNMFRRGALWAEHPTACNMTHVTQHAHLSIVYRT